MTNRSKARMFWFSLFAVIVIITATVGATQVTRIQNFFAEFGVTDYPGPGEGEAIITINPGDSGEQVASALVKAGVVKDFRLAYKVILAENPTFYPGTYRLMQKMSSSEALHALFNPNSHVYDKVIIREGLRLNNVLKALSDGLGIKLSVLKKASQDLTALGIPAGEVSAEGWLFPATYKFDPATDAKVILKTMVDRTKQEFATQKIAEKDWHRVLTLASIIQKEARQTADFYKVSRVFLNRIKVGMNLQSDATVSYGSGGNTVTTTDAERADPNGYNTYVHPGLPIGPISAPGSVAIAAAVHPAKGPWLYFCAVNLQTGKTVFSKTLAQHEVAVAQFQAWMRANPGWND